MLNEAGDRVDLTGGECTRRECFHGGGLGLLEADEHVLQPRRRRAEGVEQFEPAAGGRLQQLNEGSSLSAAAARLLITGVIVGP